MTMKEVTGFSVQNVASHNNVVRLSINNQICHFVPLETDKFFPNLETLRIWSSGLKKLDQNDIKGFEHLRELILPLNDIESLDSNLFEFNKKIKKIDLSRNKLKSVGLALLSTLRTITYINFNLNDCIDDSFKVNIDKFIEKVRTSCPPTIEMLKNDVIFVINENEKLKLSIDAKDAIIKENCDFSKFEEIGNKFEEKTEQEDYYQLHKNDGSDYKVHRYEEIDL
ncbi:unnamed protein product [Chironomus riparius]|uniref:Uncharacterized protein n=1 Tax=Chironomus riparius TaxID=315576 RepID=A0A9N9S493_9DIPT|nr:unnamed protein product [Chironomus riparius]